MEPRRRPDKPTRPRFHRGECTARPKLHCRDSPQACRLFQGRASPGESSPGIAVYRPCAFAPSCERRLYHGPNFFHDELQHFAVRAMIAIRATRRKHLIDPRHGRSVQRLHANTRYAARAASPIHTQSDTPDTDATAAETLPETTSLRAEAAAVASLDPVLGSACTLGSLAMGS